MSTTPEPNPPTPELPTRGNGPPPAAPQTRSSPLRRYVLGGTALAGLTAGAVFGVPLARTALTTVSTDDAYVNGKVTLVAPRVAGQVERVLVDDNVRVSAGQVLVELDPVPYQVQVNIKKAALEAAEADRRATESEVWGTLAQLRSQRWKLQTTMEQVDNQLALLRARVAALRSAEATREKTEADLTRARDSYTKGVSSKQDLDAAVASKRVADAQVNQAVQEVHEVRVSLGLPPQPPDGKLDGHPDDLRQTFSSVRQAVADLIRIAAQVGYPLSKSEDTPEQVLDKFRSQDPKRDVDRIFANLVPNAPAMKQADAKVLQAKRDLEQAELNLSYCTVKAEIDGVVTRCNVYRGNNVQAGQQLMAVRSLTVIWIDANFKETQLADLRIGQRADVIADTYGKRRVFRGHITGFTYGTGSTLALLPAQNATGNFVKVVQRLPVRIELDKDDYNPDEDTLFAGLSVTPYVYTAEPPTGPNAGKRLQELARPGAAPESARGADR